MFDLKYFIGKDNRLKKHTWMGRFGIDAVGHHSLITR